MASGSAVRLHGSGFRVVMTEIPAPLCVRRGVSFCEALHHGRMEVEGLTAVLADGAEDVSGIWQDGNLAVLVDPDSIPSALSSRMWWWTPFWPKPTWA